MVSLFPPRLIFLAYCSLQPTDPVLTMKTYEISKNVRPGGDVDKTSGDNKPTTADIVPTHEHAVEDSAT